MNPMTNMKFKKSIVLLSGGLDCTTALALELKNSNVKLALTFDYGQKAVDREISSAKKISKFYGIKHKVIEIDWLKDLIQKEIPILNEEDLKNKKLLKETSNKVWVPNRNALFINIAACFADTSDSEYNRIIIGANKEEAETFSDNSAEFIVSINKTLLYSTNSKVQVIAPLINKNKKEIVKLALINNAPLSEIYSCYNGTQIQCGKCESCLRLKNAINSLDTVTKNNLMIKYFGKE